MGVEPTPGYDSLMGTSRDTDFILKQLAAQSSALRALGVARIGLFGSHARGEAGPDSDVDLLVDMNVKTYDAYCDVKELLEASLGRPVDLIMSGALHPRLRPYVLSEVVYLEGP